MTDINTKVKDSSVTYNLPLPFTSELVLFEQQTASYWIWTWFAVSIWYNNNHFNTIASHFLSLSIYIYIYILNDDGFKLAKERSRRYPAKTIIDTEPRWWHSTSGKYTCPSWNPAAWSGMNSCWHKPPCQCRQDGLHVLWSNSWHLHTKW